MDCSCRWGQPKGTAAEAVSKPIPKRYTTLQPFCFRGWLGGGGGHPETPRMWMMNLNQRTADGLCGVTARSRFGRVGPSTDIIGDGDEFVIVLGVD